MRTLVLLTIFSFFLVGSLFASEKTPPLQKMTPISKVTKADIKLPRSVVEKQNHTEGVSFGEFDGGIIFQENFEPGSTWHRWKAIDLTHPRPEHGPSYWHVTTWDAKDSTCWWLADTTLGDSGGYANHWYQVLDTKPFVVTDTNAVFTFIQRYSLEGTAGAEAPYDGWDAINVRISLDSGKTWQVLPFDDYVMQNSWAFGHPSQGQNEGLGIPGWSGDQLTWVRETISLKDYVKQDSVIMLRFAFASDMGYSTADGGPQLFGWEIDSIMVAAGDSVFFFNNGENKDMTGKDIEFIPPEGGNLWHVAEFLEPYFDPYLPRFTPSPTHSAVCQNGGDVFDTTGTYNSWMDNVFETGPIALPDTAPIYLDFNHLPYFADPDGFPNDDFWTVMVRPTDSTNWHGVDESPNGGYYVFDIGFDRWVTFSYMFGYPTNMSPLDLSKYKGQDVYLRWEFWSDEDDPIGYGLMFDDVVVYSPIKTIDVPTGLTVTPNGEDTTMTISWDGQVGMTYQIWRTTPGDQYIHLIGEVADTNAFVDTSTVPFQTYYYTLRAAVEYEGTSDFVTPYGYGEIIPATIMEMSYDHSHGDTTIIAPKRNGLVYVKFTPIAYPMDLKGIKFALDTTGTKPSGAYQITVWDDDGTDSLPGTKLFYKNKSALGFGYNRYILDDSIAIDSGSFYIGLKRFGKSPVLFGETDSVDMRTYYDTDSGIVVVNYADALVHVYMDTTRTEFPTGIYDKDMPLIADRYYLGHNYPNPFNPTTNIPFVIPDYARGQKVTLSVYNILGQKVATVFEGVAHVGLNKVTWDGTNFAGKPVSSGIYIYQLKGKNVQLQRRMLLIK